MVFMCIDIDFYIDKPPRKKVYLFIFLGYLRNHNLDDTMDSTIVRMYGVNSKGNSIVAHIYNFRPYFYMQCAFNQIIEQQHLPELKRYLNVM